MRLPPSPTWKAFHPHCLAEDAVSHEPVSHLNLGNFCRHNRESFSKQRIFRLPVIRKRRWGKKIARGNCRSRDAFPEIAAPFRQPLGGLRGVRTAPQLVATNR